MKKVMNGPLRKVLPAVLEITLLAILAFASLGYAGAPPLKPALLERALAETFPGDGEIIFCSRLRYDDPHWYANIGYYCDNEQQKAYPGNGQPDLSKLYKLDLRTRRESIVLDAQGGTIRDPQMHYDGHKILFSYRKAGSDFFHLYEISIDGADLVQLTSGEYDDYEPTYLPDGGIAFVSTRCERWVNCWKTQVGVIYRCDANGQNIQLISANTEHDNTPWVMPDGRLLYTRWEYVDRSQVEYHHLWTMNPDGTGQTVFYGNMHSHIVMIDAKPIPNSDRVIANFSPGHGVNEHAGIATVVSTEGGPDNQALARALHKGSRIRDPYALSDSIFLMARNKQILLMDAAGNTEALYTLEGDGELHEPRPVLPRQRERLIPPRSEPEEAVGRMILSDVYNGRNLKGVKRGEIKKLLILESLPKQVNFSGGPDLVSFLGTFTLERVVGTVPVEPDGSAYFELPAKRQLFFVALDEHDLSVKRMQSFTSVMPGEVMGCVGCHEDRSRAPENRQFAALQALRRPPSRIERFEDYPDVLDFSRDIQPILDRHCVECHQYRQREGNTILTGDLGPHWSHSFFSLFAHGQVADGRNGLGNQPPRAIGSSASPLLKKVSGEHHDVKVSADERRLLWLWIESGAPYAGTYAALRNEQQQGRAGAATGAVLGGQAGLLKRRCGACHDVGETTGKTNKPLPFAYETRRMNRHLAGRPTGSYERIILKNDPMARYSANILLNFTCPSNSPILLGPLSKEAGGFGSCGAVFQNRDDKDYQKLLAAIEQGKSILDAEPRFSTPGFKPNPQYVREMKKYGILPADLELNRSPVDVFAVDQKYWQSAWYLPSADN